MKGILQEGMSISEIFFPPCFNEESQIRHTVRLSFRTELGSTAHHVLKDCPTGLKKSTELQQKVEV